MARKEYNKLTEAYFRDPKLIWQHTISGEKSFDSCDFLGALKDLSSVPDWKDAFAGAENMEGFLDRFELFLQHNGALTPDAEGRQSLYFSPSEKENSSKKLVELTQKYLKSCAKIAALDEYNDDNELWAERLSNLPVEWVENGQKSDIDHYSPIVMYLYEAVSEVYSDHQKKWAHFHYCLSEACYGLAADYNLQRYLMQDFYNLDIDLSSQYELEWIYGGILHFSEERCFVMAPGIS